MIGLNIMIIIEIHKARYRVKTYTTYLCFECVQVLVFAKKINHVANVVLINISKNNVDLLTVILAEMCRS